MNRRTAILGSTAAILGAFVPKGILGAPVPKPPSEAIRANVRLFSQVIKRGNRLTAVKAIEFEDIRKGMRVYSVDLGPDGKLLHAEFFTADSDPTFAPEDVEGVQAGAPAIQVTNRRVLLESFATLKSGK